MSSKMREVLLKAEVLVSLATFDEGVNMNEVEKIRSEIKAAIAEPLRNCDVGTADEQSARFHSYCLKHGTSPNCGNCPLFKMSGRCEFFWSQMPYESEVKK